MANITFIHKLLLGAALFLLAAINLATGQNGNNPFELQPRLPETAADSLDAVPISTNPFDIVVQAASEKPGTTTGPGFYVPKIKKPKLKTAKEKETEYKRFLFVAIIAMFVILTLIVTIFRILIQKIWRAFTRDNMMHQLHREQSSGLVAAYAILYVLYFISGGLFAFLVSRHFGLSISVSNFYALVICMGAIAGFFIAKHFVLWFVGFVFPVGKEVGSYQFTIMIFNIILGLFLVPVVLVVAYARPSMTGMIIWAAMGLLGIVYLFLSLRGLFIGNRFIADNKFHFLLYLCAVEFAPLLVIYKIAMTHGVN